MTEKTSKNTQDFDFRSIETPEDAFKKCGYSPFKKLIDPLIPERYRDGFSAAIILAVVFEAINDGWIADPSDHNQAKYFPWPGVSSSGLGFSGSDFTYDYATARVGFPLCTDSPEKALYIFERFTYLWKAWLLNVKPE